MADLARELTLIASIDYCMFALERMVKSGPDSGLDALIDEATGYDQKRLEDARELTIQLRDLCHEHHELTGEERTRRLGESAGKMADALLEVANA